jgi:hypothetical protein
MEAKRDPKLSCRKVLDQALCGSTWKPQIEEEGA